jgi:hypothetical protein
MQQNIDSYFKEKLQPREFELKAAYWQQAEALLEAEEKKKRRGLLLWWGGGLLSVLAIAAILFLKNGETSPIQTSANQELTSIENTMAASNEVAKESTAEKPPIAPVTEKTNASPTINLIKNNKKKSQTKSITTLERAAVAQKMTSETPPAATNLSMEKRPNASQTASVLPEKTIGRNAAPDAVSLLTLLVDGDFPDQPPMGLKAGEGCFAPSPFHFGVTASQLMQAWPKSGENAITGFYGGVFFQYDLRNRWALSAGLGYTYRDGHFDVSKSTTTRQYRFGLEEMENQLRPTSLHYVSMPISLSWKRRQHILEGGVWLDYLAGLRGAIGSIERVDPDLPKKVFVAREKGWIAEDGFTRFNVSPTVGYRYLVNQHWSFGVSAQYALKNMTSPEPEKYILQEDDRFQLRLQAVYLIK